MIWPGKKSKVWSKDVLEDEFPVEINAAVPDSAAASLGIE